MPDPSSYGISHISHDSHLASVQMAKSALGTTLTGEPFADIKLYAFSKRTNSGDVGEPRVLYANSKVLKASSVYFAHCEYPQSIIRLHKSHMVP